MQGCKIFDLNRTVSLFWFYLYSSTNLAATYFEIDCDIN